jgi:adenylate kinase family enzyme
MIVMISGKQGSGKTTLANLIEQKLDPNVFHVKRAKFADPMYEIYNFAKNITGVEKEKDGTFLQIIGDWGRSIDPTIWINSFKRKNSDIDEKSLFGFKKLLIVDDLRFKKEFVAFDDAIRIRLECPRQIRMERCTSWREDDCHISETDLDDWNTRFDLTLDSSKFQTQSLAEIVIEKIYDKSFKTQV